MRGIFCFLFVAMFMLPAVAATPNLGHLIIGGSQIPSGPTTMPHACQLVEEALGMQLMMFGRVEGAPIMPMMRMQIGQARTFRELARRGCIENRTRFAIQYRAALETAWAVLDIEYPTLEAGVFTDEEVASRLAARRRYAAELREIERAPAAGGW